MTNALKSKKIRDEADLARAGVLPIGDPGQGCRPIAWPDQPAALGGSASGLPAFPMEALPAWFRDVVEDFARGVHAAPELCALACIAATGAALGPGWRVGTQGLTRGPAVWCAIVAPSGNAKTPAAAPCIAPVVSLDSRLREEHEHAQAEAREAARAAGRKRSEDPPAPRRRALVTDTTPEALLAVLQANGPHGLLWHADEIATLLEGLDHYQKGRWGRSIVLSIWSGVAVRAVRKMSESAEVDRPFLTVFGTTQPSTLRTLALRDGDGLTARFLWAHAEPHPRALGPGASARAIGAWTKAIEAAGRAGEGETQRFDEAGEALLDDYLRETSTDASESERAGLGLAASVLAKAPDQAVRLAAVLHGLDAITGAIDAHPLDAAAPLRATVPAATVERAIALARYFVEHGKATARLVVASPGEQEADGRTGADNALAAALLRLVPAGQRVDHEPARWAELLATAGVSLSPDAVGMRFKRLEHHVDTGLAVAKHRGKRRVWSVSRP